ncbi:MAG: ABC transporter ATP-binding protein [Synergistaceae bacterium]|nr:ABC transporter ATP-binding protein [Synergistaceae bacterium]
MNIAIENLRCGYGGRVVVDGFSAEIESGEIFCILGPNGVGKTTLFKTVLGLLPLMGGNITIDGRDMTKLPAREIARLAGYVPQSRPPPFAFTVSDVVVMGRTSRMSAFSSPGRRDYIVAGETMDRLGIGFLRDRVYTELSGGERQMVLIARALAQEPAFLMMDEPTSSLDFGNQAILLENVAKLASEGMGVIMTTHYPQHVLQCEARVALMKNGKSFSVGSAWEVITEENLRDAYGIPVAVASVAYGEERLYCCQPLLRLAEKTEEHKTNIKE